MCTNSPNCSQQIPVQPNWSPVFFSSLSPLNCSKGETPPTLVQSFAVLSDNSMFFVGVRFGFQQPQNPGSSLSNFTTIQTSSLLGGSLYFSPNYATFSGATLLNVPSLNPANALEVAWNPVVENNDSSLAVLTADRQQIQFYSVKQLLTTPVDTNTGLQIPISPVSVWFVGDYGFESLSFSANGSLFATVRQFSTTSVAFPGYSLVYRIDPPSASSGLFANASVVMNIGQPSPQVVPSSSSVPLSLPVPKQFSAVQLLFSPLNNTVLAIIIENTYLPRQQSPCAIFTNDGQSGVPINDSSLSLNTFYLLQNADGSPLIGDVLEQTPSSTATDAIVIPSSQLVALPFNTTASYNMNAFPSAVSCIPVRACLLSNNVIALSNWTQIFTTIS